MHVWFAEYCIDAKIDRLFRCGNFLTNLEIMISVVASNEGQCPEAASGRQATVSERPIAVASKITSQTSTNGII